VSASVTENGREADSEDEKKRPDEFNNVLIQ